MPEVIPADSVGLALLKSMAFQAPPPLACGTNLPEFTPYCTTCGELYASRSNAILTRRALSCYHHAAHYRSMNGHTTIYRFRRHDGMDAGHGPDC